MKILIPLPAKDFDPTEVGVSWEILHLEHDITFATPSGEVAIADKIMVHGKGLGFFSKFLIANSNGQNALKNMQASPEFQTPISYQQIKVKDYDALILPGGHAKGMKEYLESKILQLTVSYFFDNDLPVAAICHGVVLAARSKSSKTGKSCLYDKKTTALLKSSEMLAWNLTKKRMGSYYRTYPETTVEEEVIDNLKDKKQFLKGPPVFFRDNLKMLFMGFTVIDGNYISARWPGDVHRFAIDFNKILKSKVEDRHK